METYCQNPLCENMAVKEVPVSVRTPADQVRSLCATCEEAYTWGVQHGKMIAQQGTLWILAVADRGIIAHVRVYNSNTEAEKGMVEYLREHENCNCLDDVNLAYLWLAEHDERMRVEIVPQEVRFTKPKDVGGDSKTADLAHVNDFLHQCAFAVLTKNPQTRDPNASFEAWAYKGLLDFQSAEPVVFGLGCNCHGALDALDLKLAELKPGGNGSRTECLE